MNAINFLPKSFAQRRRRRNRLIAECFIVLAAIVGFAGLYWNGDRGLQSLRDSVREIETDGTAVRAQLKEMAALQERHRTLSGQLRIHRQVTLPIGFAQVLSAVAALTPQSIGYTDLILDVRRPVPPARVDPNSEKAKKPPKGKSAAPSAGDGLRVELTGLSPDDERIADLVGKLADCKLFSDVKLEFSRPTEKDNLLVKRFRVSMQVPLDREYRSTQKREGVANAD